MSGDHHHHQSDRPTLARAAKIPVIGIGGPVVSGKTALVEALCRQLRDQYSLAVVTNDIFTKEDAEFLTRRGALSGDRIVGVETGAVLILPFAKMRRTIRKPSMRLSGASRASS